MDINQMGLANGFPHVHSSLYSNNYGQHEYHPQLVGQMQPQGDMHMQSSTCVPSLIPPGIDPAQVDMRTFYPYQPNEVKHRKRTTRPQLKVLEEVYKYDTKPVATTRKKLAEELGMTPRGVQVWFQNRRAKEKNLARKAEAAESAKKPDGSDSDKNPPESPSSSSPTPVSANSKQGTSTSPEGQATPPPGSRSPTSSPMTIPRIRTSDATEGQRPSGRTMSNPDELISSDLLLPGPSAAELLAQRRPSLPANALSTSAMSPNLSALRSGGPSTSQRGAPPGFDPTMRRRSVDTNMRRLSAHPYAHLAQHANKFYGGATSPRAQQTLTFHSGLGLTADGPNRLDSVPAGLGGRMGVAGRHGSMPHVLQHTRSSPPSDSSRAMPSFYAQPSRPMPSQKHSLPPFPDSPRAPGMASRSLSMSSSPMFTNPFAAKTSSPHGAAFDAPIPPDRPASPSTTSPPPISQSFQHGHGLYAPMRSLQPPIPGPLPEPTFTFGFPSSSPSLSSASSPSDGSTVMGANSGENDDARNAEEDGDEGSAASSTYDPASRFGSFASVGSETSWTTYWSDGGSQGTKQGPEGFDAERRGSFASYCLPQLLGGLDVGGNGNGTQQSFSDEPSAEHQHLTATQIVEQRRGSSSSHDQVVYSTDHHDAFQGQNAVHSAPEQQGPFLGEDQAPYGQEQNSAYTPPGPDAYSPSSTISAGSQMPVEKTTPSAVLPHSSSSELVYALQPPGDVGVSKPGQFVNPFPDTVNSNGANGQSSLNSQQHFEASPYDQVYDQPLADYTFPHQPHNGYNQAQQSVEYEYGPQGSTLVYPPDGMDPLCVPPPMTMDNSLHNGDYVPQYA